MITVDRREVTQHPEIEQLLVTPYQVTTLEAGDYAFLDRDKQPIAIERSEISNLIQKIHSGELESQMEKASEMYVTTILLIEGVYDGIRDLLSVYSSGNRGYYRKHVYPHTRFSTTQALISGLSEMGIEIIWSPGFEESMTTVDMVYSQRTRPEEQRTLFRKIRRVSVPAKLTNDPAVGRLMGLCPRLSEKTALSLIIKFGSIWGVLNASDIDILSVKGMGRGLLDRLKKEVGKLEPVPDT